MNRNHPFLTLKSYYRKLWIEKEKRILNLAKTNPKKGDKGYAYD
jgi:hypothetical protein